MHTTIRGRLLTVGAIAGVSLAGAAIALATHTNYDIQVATKAGFHQTTLPDGSIVQFIGETSPQGHLGSSGSGIYEAFLRVQKNPNERGYNTDANKFEFDEKGGNFTHSIKLSEIPTVQVGGNEYWELYADLNESNTSPASKISLDDMEVYLTTNPAITGYPFTGTADLIYDYTTLNGNNGILINDVNPGSGRGDVRYLIPVVSGPAVPTNCNYGNGACSTYFVLFTVWGATGGDFTSDATFEEWKVRRYPIPTVSKTVDGVVEVPVVWDIVKEADATYTRFAGDELDHQYTIDPIPSRDTNNMTWTVSGTITITGDPDDATTLTSVEDVFEGHTATLSNCTFGTLPATLAANAVHTCDYTLDPGGEVTGTNTATIVTTPVAGVALTSVAHAQLDTYTEQLTGPTSVTVSDDLGNPSGTPATFGPFTIDDHGAFSYDRTFACPTDLNLYDANGLYTATTTNTAEIVQTSDSDEATVTLNCHIPLIEKTAAGLYTRDIDWTIGKADDAVEHLLAGETYQHGYTITWGKTVTNVDHRVAGQITVTNTHPSAAQVVTLNDQLNDGDVAQLTGCSGGTLVGSQLTIPAGMAAVCDYTVTGVVDGTETSNTATADTGAVSVQATEPLSFDDDGNPDGPDQITITDDDTLVQTTIGPFSDSGSETYSRDFVCPTDGYDASGVLTIGRVNTATIDRTGQNDDATVVVNCYAPNVSKTAATAFDRTYTWDVTKTSDAPSPVDVMPGQSFVIGYDVTVGVIGVTDDQHTAAGGIQVHNPHPSADMTVKVSDQVTGGPAGVVETCGGVPYDDAVGVTISAGATVDCTWSATGLTTAHVENVATATMGNVNRTGSAALDWSSATITEIDEQIGVSDSLVGGVGGPLGTITVTGLGTGVSVSGVPAGVTATVTGTSVLFEYDIDVLDLGVQCGDNRIENTATTQTNDLSILDSATHLVPVIVHCQTGCTLTQGYWKTHSHHGPAPYDDAWLNLGDVDLDGASEGADELFPFHPDFGSPGYSLTYHQILWTPPAGGNAWYQLAHQYIAAHLNALNGADSSAVATTLTESEDLLAGWTPEQVGSLRGRTGNEVKAEFRDRAGWLAAYNEGAIGPGHCDEDGNSAV